MVPRTWRRPLTLIYDRNYKYGTGLYSDAISEIERRYLQSMARTRIGFSAASLGTGVLSPGHVLRAPEVPSHLQSVLTKEISRGVRSVPEIDSYFLQLPRRRYRHLIADPFNFEEKARVRRRMRRSKEEGGGEEEGKSSVPPLHHRHHFDGPELVTGSIPHFLFHYWRRSHPLTSLSDFSLLYGKCQRLQSELEMAGHRVSDVRSKLKWDAVTSGSKAEQEMRVVELEAELQAIGRDNSELHKVIKRQARQIEEMQSLQDELHRHLGQAHEEVVTWQRRYNDLQFQVTTVRHSHVA